MSKQSNIKVMSKNKISPVDLSVSIGRLRFSPLDKKLCGNVLLSSSTRSFRILPSIRPSSFHFAMQFRFIVSHGCLWSKCVRDTSVICSRCEYNIPVL